MKVFVAGATGVLGRRVVRLLLREGHEVAGLSRSHANGRILEALGAEPREGSLFDASSLIEASAGCEIFLHLATAIPAKVRTRPSDWKVNDMIRRQGTRSLVAAARHHRCRLYVQQSVTLVYGDRHGEWVDERAEIGPLPGILRSAFDMERIVREAAEKGDLPAVVLRCGRFYSHDSALTRIHLEMTRRGRAPVIGEGSAWWSLVHADDAAEAFLAAVARPGEGVGRTLNICDDEPVRYRDLQAGITDLLSAARPGRMPRWLGRLFLGDHTIGILEASARCRNGAAREALGWSPGLASWREGYRRVIQEWSRDPSAPGASAREAGPRGSEASRTS